jgi:hypothetical protein
MLACSQFLQVGRPLVRSGLDHVGVGLKQPDSQQPVVVSRLLVRWNSQPLVVRVE